MIDAEIKDITCHFLDLLDPRITEFEYFFAILADQVIVLFVFMGFFELSQILSELMLGNKVAIQ